MGFRDLIKAHVDSLYAGIGELNFREVELVLFVLLEAQETGRQVFLFGNGGSAATASHFACDLAKTAAVSGKPPLRAISLTHNAAMMSAIANDISYNDVFVAQMSVLWNYGDVAIGISVSGNSPSVLRTIQYARDHGGKTIAFSGFGGGKLAELAELNIVFSSRNYGVVEDMHMILGHMISQGLREQTQSTGLSRNLAHDSLVIGKPEQMSLRNIEIDG